jgi:predicted RNA methylase
MKDPNTGEIVTPIKRTKVSDLRPLRMYLEAGEVVYTIHEGHTLSDIARFFIRQCGCKSDAVYLINDVNKRLKK